MLEERRQRVREGDNIFIDNSDEEVLKTGRMPTAGPSRRSDTPIPVGVSTLFHLLDLGGCLLRNVGLWLLPNT